MVSRPDYLQASEHREAGLEQTVLMATTQAVRPPAPLLYCRAMFRRTPITTTFNIVLAAFAAAWITLDVLIATGVI